MSEQAPEITESNNKCSKLLFAVGLIFVIYAFVTAFAGPQRVLGNYLVDDSLYYYGIAQHVAAGNGSVFDGINQTNGYHPLWMLTLVPVYWIFGANSFTAFTAAICLQAVIFALVLRMLSGLGKFLGLSEKARALSMLVIASPLFFHLWVNGLESTLLGFFVLAALWQYLRVKSSKDDNAKGRILLGLLCAFAFLSRVDSVFFPLTIIAFEIIEAIKTRKFLQNFYRALAVSIMMLVIGGPYLLRNFLIFGNIIPISGAIKTPAVSGSVARFGTETGGLLWPAVKVANIIHIPLAVAAAAMIVVLIITVLLLVLSFRRLGEKVPANAAKAFGVYLVYCCVHYSYVALRMGHFCNTMWYYIPAILGGGISLGVIVSAFVGEKTGRWAAIILIITTMIFAAGGGFYRLSRPNGLYTARLDAAKWISEHLPAKRGAAFDAGIVGYFSGGNVVNLDGLVNNLTLQKYQQEGRLDQYLLDMEIDYVAQYMAADGKGKRASWIKDELSSVLAEKPLYSKDFYTGSKKMQMFVFEVSR